MALSGLSGSAVGVRVGAAEVAAAGALIGIAGGSFSLCEALMHRDDERRVRARRAGAGNWMLPPYSDNEGRVGKTSRRLADWWEENNGAVTAHRSA